MASKEQDVDMSLDEEDVAIFLGEHLVNMILERSSLDTIEGILVSGAPVWYQNQTEGASPLHAAAYTRNPALAKLLIEKGAIWNAVDYLNNTAGDIALSFNDAETYTVIRDAGIRAELLLRLLASKRAPGTEEPPQADVEESDPSNIILRETDATAAGSTDAFLQSKLTYSVDKYGQQICMLKLGDDEVGVMMGWEEGIMKETVKRLCEDHPNAENLSVLNVGFGLGIIDGLFQALPIPPKHHVIIEPHPDVLQHMRETGWYDKPGVKILEGKWQDLTESEELLSFGGFDVVYTDTFSEDYSSLHSFFEKLPDMLSGPDSRFSFFNGLGATNPLFYDVYTHISDLNLSDIGLNVEWSDVRVSFNASEDRWGKSREYFTVPIYRLPIAKMNTIS